MTDDFGIQIRNLIILKTVEASIYKSLIPSTGRASRGIFQNPAGAGLFQPYLPDKKIHLGFIIERDYIGCNFNVIRTSGSYCGAYENSTRHTTLGSRLGRCRLGRMWKRGCLAVRNLTALPDRIIRRDEYACSDRHGVARCHRDASPGDASCTDRFGHRDRHIECGGDPLCIETGSDRLAPTAVCHHRAGWQWRHLHCRKGRPYPCRAWRYVALRCLS